MCSPATLEAAVILHFRLYCLHIVHAGTGTHGFPAAGLLSLAQKAIIR